MFRATHRLLLAPTLLPILCLISACQTTTSGTTGLSDADEEAMFTVEKKQSGEIVDVSGQFGRDWTFGDARTRVREICQQDGLTYGGDFEAEQISIREIMAYSASCGPAGYEAPKKGADEAT